MERVIVEWWIDEFDGSYHFDETVYYPEDDWGPIQHEYVYPDHDSAVAVAERRWPWLLEDDEKEAV